MKVNPGADRVVLTSESDLEFYAIARWSNMRATTRRQSWEELAIEFSDREEGPPDRRGTRVPAIRQRVRVAGLRPGDPSRDGVVESILAYGGEVGLGVRFGGDPGHYSWIRFSPGGPAIDALGPSPQYCWIEPLDREDRS